MERNVLWGLVAIFALVAVMVFFRPPDKATSVSASNEGVAEMARFFAFAEQCYRDSFVPLGEMRAVRRNATNLGYNPLNHDMIKEAVALSDRIKKDESSTICKTYQSHIDKILFGYGYKAGSDH